MMEVCKAHGEESFAGAPATTGARRFRSFGRTRLNQQGSTLSRRSGGALAGGAPSWTLSWTNCYRWLGALVSPANDKETRNAAIECGPGGSYEEEGPPCLIFSRSAIASGHAAPPHRPRHILLRPTQ